MVMILYHIVFSESFIDLDSYCVFVFVLNMDTGTWCYGLYYGLQELLLYLFLYSLLSPFWSHY